MNDELCPYYEVHRQVLRSKIITGGRGPRPSRIVDSSWCSHPKHSPVSRQAARTVSGANLLACGGELDNCPLTPDQFHDLV